MFLNTKLRESTKKKNKLQILSLRFWKLNYVLTYYKLFFFFFTCPVVFMKCDTHAEEREIFILI